MRVGGEALVADEPDPSIGHQPQPNQLEQVQPEDQPRVGLEELPNESLRPVPSHEDVEAAPHRPRGASLKAHEIEGQKEAHGEGLIDLHRVPPDAIAQVYRPGQRGRGSVGVVRDTGEQAAPAADDDADRQGSGEGDAGRACDSSENLVELDPYDAAGQHARDRM